MGHSVQPLLHKMWCSAIREKNELKALVGGGGGGQGGELGATPALTSRDVLNCDDCGHSTVAGSKLRNDGLSSPFKQSLITYVPV